MWEEKAIIRLINCLRKLDLLNLSPFELDIEGLDSAHFILVLVIICDESTTDYFLHLEDIESTLKSQAQARTR